MVITRQVREWRVSATPNDSMTPPSLVPEEMLQEVGDGGLPPL